MTDPKSFTVKSDLEKKQIDSVYVSDLFNEISSLLGYPDVELYIPHLAALVNLWEKQGFIEIYEKTADRAYGRAKDSTSAPNSVPWYIGLYHVRLLDTGENDPLVVIVFEDEDQNGTVKTAVSLRFILNHDSMFGDRDYQKFRPDEMRAIRKRIDAFIQRGNK